MVQQICYYANQVQAAIEPAIMIQRMLERALEIRDNDLVVDRYDETNGLAAVIRSFAVYDYIQKILESKIFP